MDNTLPWVVTALFAVSFAAYGYFLVAQRRCWTSVVSQLLHLAMSGVMMVAMAWMYGAMNGSVSGRSDHPGLEAMNMPAHSAASGLRHAAHHTPSPDWVDVVNWTAALGFAAVAT